MVTISIASIEEREHLLHKTVQSLIKQCDYLQIQLNNYSKVPDWCKEMAKSKPLYWTITDNKIGDGYKFFNLDKLDGYIFTCDDDLIYPTDYVQNTIHAIDYYNCIVAYHGRITTKKPLDSYYDPKNRLLRCHCILEFKEDRPMHVLGSGVAAWHSDFFKISHTDVHNKNMADIYLAKVASMQEVKLMALAHKRGWIKYQNPKSTIYEDVKTTLGYNDEPQTKLYNSFENTF